MEAEVAWKEAVGVDATQLSWWSRILEAYSAHERRYHNLTNLEKKLRLLQELGGASDARALTIAIFFQYFEYNPQEGDSAAINVVHFRAFADEANMDATLRARVEGLLSTEGGGDDRSLLLDLDMAALGAPSDQYHQLMNDVRAEYSFLADGAYKSLRRKILQSFLLIPNIYSTQAFRDKFENQARINIEQEVAVLQADSS